MEKFDVSYVDENGKEMTKKVKNDLGSISKFLHTVPEEAVLCAEHTGVYGDLLVFLSKQVGIKIALSSGYNIKHSLGMTKGKSDPIDSTRIREYGERFYDKLVFNEQDKEEMIELKSLYTLRSQLVRARKVLRTGEHSCSKKTMQSIIEKRHRDTALDSLDAEINAIEAEMDAIIKTNSELNENYRLATSVKGIGPIIATDLIIKTGNFKTIDTAQKAASYAGVCPFPNESGKMKGKPKTSMFADRKLKTLLYMAAKTIVKHNKEYRLYYQRKQMEGKHHFLIMNNVSNKMLRTIYSVIKSKIPYRQDYICLDPRERSLTSSTKKVA